MKSRFGKVVPISKKVTSELTLRPDPVHRPWVKVEAYVPIGNGKALVPKYYDFQAHPIPVQDRELAHTQSMSPGAASLVQLQPNLGQAEAVQAVQDAWNTRGGAILCLPTGFGKTCVAVHLAVTLHKKTLVVCHKKFLVDQWADRIATFAPGASVTKIAGGTFDASGDFVLATVQSIVSKKAWELPEFDAFGLLVWDEVHHCAAEVFGKIMFGCSFPRILGLSATPDRKDGLARLVEWFMGPVCYRRESPRVFPNVKIHVWKSEKYLQPPPVNSRDQINHAAVINQISECPDRLVYVVDLVRRELARGHRVLCLSHRRQHCEVITAKLHAGGEPAVALYLGGQKQPPPPESRCIVATYNLVSEGFDDPGLTCLILATPASDVVQACGRIGRGISLKNNNLIIHDIIDAWGPCYAQAAKRRSFYNKHQFSIQKS